MAHRPTPFAYTFFVTTLFALIPPINAQQEHRLEAPIIAQEDAQRVSAYDHRNWCRVVRNDRHTIEHTMRTCDPSATFQWYRHKPQENCNDQRIAFIATHGSNISGSTSHRFSDPSAPTGSAFFNAAEQLSRQFNMPVDLIFPHWSGGTWLPDIMKGGNAVARVVNYCLNSVHHYPHVIMFGHSNGGTVNDIAIKQGARPIDFAVTFDTPSDGNDIPDNSKLKKHISLTSENLSVSLFGAVALQKKLNPHIERCAPHAYQVITRYYDSTKDESGAHAPKHQEKIPAILALPTLIAAIRQYEQHQYMVAAIDKSLQEQCHIYVDIDKIDSLKHVPSKAEYDRHASARTGLLDTVLRFFTGKKQTGSRLRRLSSCAALHSAAHGDSGCTSESDSSGDGEGISSAGTSDTESSGAMRAGTPNGIFPHTRIAHTRTQSALIPAIYHRYST